MDFTKLIIISYGRTDVRPYGLRLKNNASHMHNSIYFTLLDEFSFERGKSESNHRLSLSKPGGIFQDLLIRIGCKKLRMETGRKSQSL
jgi:hypothetical protein